MFKATLLLLLATQGLCNPIGAYRHPRMGGWDSAPIITNFSWQEFAANTGVDPKAYITTPGKGIEENFTCTKQTGPDRIDCPGAISAWTELTEDSHLKIKAGQCIAATNNLCRTAVCAPRGPLNIHIDQIIGRMWNPLSMKCVLGGRGGILQSKDSAFIIEMGTPQE
ncbi:hypothetical protein EDB80DRAFT_438827 [Ilyonectria destructans]|nr:hypothetical protein EDB80DRAFT_438827 [Ilyonectria destructans]